MSGGGPPSNPPVDLLARLREHKPQMLRFLSCWIDTPYGEAKFWGFVGEDRCGVVLRNQPDRVTWVKRSELMIKPSKEDRAAARRLDEMSVGRGKIFGTAEAPATRQKSKGRSFLAQRSVRSVLPQVIQKRV